jgi:FKBP-type peptidyl-prolyl cis-trans isomerase FkpA
VKKLVLISLTIILLLGACQNQNQSETIDADTVMDAEALIDINRNLVNKDVVKGVEYAKSNGWNFKQLGNGILYETLVSGNGQLPVSKDYVSFKYALKLLDSTEIIYSSDHLGPIQFIVDYGEVESGLNEMAKIMHQGDSVRCILPPHMAYGLLGDGKKIPPRSSLLYFLKLDSVEKAN